MAPVTLELQRREALTGLLAALMAALPATPPGWLDGGASAADLPLARETFLSVSSKLCGLPVRGGALSELIQKSVVEKHPPDALKALAELVAATAPADIAKTLEASPSKALARDIVAFWYAGRTGPATHVVTHEAALAWRATGYAKAPGTCGEYAEWTAPPKADTPTGDKR